MYKSYIESFWLKLQLDFQVKTLDFTGLILRSITKSPAQVSITSESVAASPEVGCCLLIYSVMRD